MENYTSIFGKKGKILILVYICKKSKNKRTSMAPISALMYLILNLLIP